MAVQSQINLDTTPFITKEIPRASRNDDSVILQDAGRGTTALAPYTVMAQISAVTNQGKWVPFTDVAAVNGTAKPSGIFLPSDIQGEITGAQLVAGDVTDVSILTFGAQVDEDKMVFENSLDLDTILAIGTIHEQSVREALLKISIMPVTTYAASNPQT